MPVKVSMKVNGKPVSADVEARTLLVTLIREHLRLTGTHVGCDTAQCGACTVHMNGKAVKSCSMLAMQAEGADILTIEGLAKADGTLHPMQAAFKEHHGLQCGFCTPGMVMNAVDFAARHPNASEQEVREARPKVSGRIDSVASRSTKRQAYAKHQGSDEQRLQPVAENDGEIDVARLGERLCVGANAEHSEDERRGRECLG